MNLFLANEGHITLLCKSSNFPYELESQLETLEFMGVRIMSRSFY